MAFRPEEKVEDVLFKNMVLDNYNLILQNVQELIDYNYLFGTLNYLAKKYNLTENNYLFGTLNYLAKKYNLTENQKQMLLSMISFTIDQNENVHILVDYSNIDELYVSIEFLLEDNFMFDEYPQVYFKYAAQNNYGKFSDKIYIKVLNSPINLPDYQDGYNLFVLEDEEIGYDIKMYFQMFLNSALDPIYRYYNFEKNVPENLLFEFERLLKNEEVDMFKDISEKIYDVISENDANNILQMTIV